MTIRLSSSPLIHAPGMLRYCLCAAETDLPQGLSLMAACWPELPLGVAEQLISGAQKFSVENETVVIETEEERDA